MFAKLAFKSLVNNKRFSALFILNLAIGLFSFIAISSFNHSITSVFSKNSKNLLGGDISISARYQIEPQKWRQFKKNLNITAAETEVLYTYSMISAGETSRLMQLKGIDASFPLYGEIEVEGADFNSSNGLWADPEVLTQLQVSVGDSVKLGGMPFKILGKVVTDPSSGLMNFWAPRLYIRTSDLLKTDLIQKGSIVTYSKYLKFTEERDLKSLALEMESFFNDPNIKVSSHESSSQQISRLTSYLNDYLGLVALVALFLAALGSGFLFRNHLFNSLKDVAIYQSLGLNLKKSSLVFVYQVLLLSLLAILPIFILLPLIFPFLISISGDLVPANLEFSLQFKDILGAFLISSLGSLSICLPFLKNLEKIKIKDVLLEEKNIKINFELSILALFLPFVLVYWGLSVYVAKSFFIGSIFCASLIASFLLLSLCSKLFINLLRGRKEQNSIRALSYSYLKNNRLGTLVIFSVIGLCSLLLQFIPQMEYSLNSEITTSPKNELPSFFLFDIQEEQLTELQEVLKSLEFELSDISPFIRSKLLSVNSQSFEGMSNQEEVFSREAERERRFRNRGFNLSYRQKMSDSEKLIEGTEFSGVYNGDYKKHPAEISVETRYAKRLGFHLGDILKFDVQGIEILAKIVNLRKVKWTSFRPNFFIQFQKGVLEEAPKTFVGVVDNISFADKARVQNMIVESLPNISIVDVSKLVEKIQFVISQISWALLFMAVVIFICGILVIYTISQQQIQNRQFDISLYKVLGMGLKDIESIFVKEILSISIFASGLGSILSIVFAYIAGRMFFDSTWDINGVYFAIGFCSINLVVFATTKIILAYTLSRKSKNYLI